MMRKNILTALVFIAIITSLVLNAGVLESADRHV